MKPTLAEHINAAERRLELRRDRTLRHLQAAREQIDSKIQRVQKWTPLVIVGLAGAAGSSLAVA